MQPWFPYEGAKHAQLWGNGTAIWQEFTNVVPGAGYANRMFLRSQMDDALRGGAYGVLALEWYNAAGALISSTESAHVNNHTTNTWTEYAVFAQAPPAATKMRKVVKVVHDTNQAPNLVLNGGMVGTNEFPDAWVGWSPENHMPANWLSHSGPSSWLFWWESFQGLSS